MEKLRNQDQSFFQKKENFKNVEESEDDLFHIFFGGWKKLSYRTKTKLAKCVSIRPKSEPEKSLHFATKPSFSRFQCNQ
jgi:hypothetical protein